MYRAELAHFGFEHTGTIGAGKTATEIGGLPIETPLELARRIVQQYPETDTVHLSCPHWPVLDALESIERELGVKAVGASQAIFWKAFRMCGVEDRFEGFGCLLREF
jgi:maleate cis-trans isomerase